MSESLFSASVETGISRIAKVSGKNKSDSLSRFRIDVTVTEKAREKVINSATPLQVMNSKEIGKTNSLLVSDAARFFSGAVIKDYGGLGGIKTLSVRSMGANHTAVAYDGVAITDCQTGQTDLGRYSLDNVESLSLDIGDGNNIFKPARMFASSGLLSISSKIPEFEGVRRMNAKLGIRGGSFGYAEGNSLLEMKLGSKSCMNFSAEYLHSDGDYPYKIVYGSSSDESTTEKRTNNDIDAFHLESTLFGNFGNKGQLEMKSYFYQSSRGLPGAVILYNSSGSQHLWDKNGFMQGHFEKNISGRAAFQLNGKYNQSWERYLNPDYLGSAGKEDYNFRQEEYYLSAAFLMNPVNQLSFSFSADGAINRMNSNMLDFANPSRYTILANMSAKYVNDFAIVTAGLLGTSVNEEVPEGEAGGNVRKISPSVNVSLLPVANSPFRLRFFYKESFRMPSFNDLYYSAVGNRDLKPEDSRQLNAGITGSKGFEKTGTVFSGSIDFYNNRITDKIQAIPTKNIFVWSMVNLGKVDIKGADISFEVRQKAWKNYYFTACWNHSYQRALDVTTKESPTYDNQIAYAPRIYGSGRIGISTPFIDIAYAVIYSGHRYATGQNLAENDLPGYSDHSISFEKRFTAYKRKMDVKAEFMNILNSNYEVIRNFPMSGRSLRIGCNIEL